MEFGKPRGVIEYARDVLLRVCIGKLFIAPGDYIGKTVLYILELPLPKTFRILSGSAQLELTAVSGCFSEEYESSKAKLLLHDDLL